MFHIFFVRPIFNVLILIYSFLPIKDIGLAVIIFVFLFRLFLFPFFKKSFFTQRKMSEIAPEIKKIQQQYKSDLKKQAEEIQRIYKEHKVNPFHTFLIFLIQLPIIIALYKVFLSGFGKEILDKEIYSFFPKPEAVNLIFLGLIDLSKKSFLFALVVAFVQIFQAKFSSHHLPPQQISSQKSQLETFQKIFQRQITFISPLITFLVLMLFPSIVALYWLTTLIFSFFENFLAQKFYERENS